MRNLTWVVVLSLFLAACGQEQSPQPVEEPLVEDQPAIEAPEADAVPEEAAEEVLQVVEESASEAEPEEQAIILAQADVPAPPVEWKYSEGEHYARLVPTQPTVGGADKVEVAEFFWYGCPHCFTLEPYINQWAEDKPANSRLVRIPASWNGILVLHAKVFYTQEILARNGVLQDGPGFHQAVFEEYHRRGNRMTSETAIRRLFERFGVSAEDFEKTWNSFEVAQKMRVGQDLMRRYSISSVPAIVVNGKYRTGAAEAGGYSELLDLIDELILRESVR
jgi:thiol:disulfide interchange protein DsbA